VLKWGKREAIGRTRLAVGVAVLLMCAWGFPVPSARAEITPVAQYSMGLDLPLVSVADERQAKYPQVAQNTGGVLVLRHMGGYRWGLSSLVASG
jgi:hypothetical protein